MQSHRFLATVTIVFIMALFIVPVGVAGGEQEQIPSRGKPKVFSDVGSGHWAYKPVTRMAGRNIISGYPDGSFRPQQMVSRAEFASMLSATAGNSVASHGPSEYADVPAGAWYEPAVQSAGRFITGVVVKDGNRYFSPRDEATREVVVTALVKALGVEYRYTDPGLLREQFSDYPEIDASATLPLTWAAKNNLIKGFPDGSLRPKHGISRAEVAALLYRAFFLDTSIGGLMAAGEIAPLDNSDKEYNHLLNILENKFNVLNMGSVQTYGIEYFAREMELYDGDGPRVLYLFAGIEPKYHSWEADFNQNQEPVLDFVRSVAGETARIYPQDIVLVMIGHNMEILFDVSNVYPGKYLTGMAGGWRLERFYAGVVMSHGTVTQTWSE
ncbi:MAG: S-layer homology domain-containing protein [Firmicutes bacterium]|nr:S-layer homology domain-containing protein [Bacillota bacterium]